MVLTARQLLRIADQMGSGDVVVVANLAPAQAREVAFRAVGVGAGGRAVERAVVDPGNVIPRVQFIS